MGVPEECMCVTSNDRLRFGSRDRAVLGLGVGIANYRLFHCDLAERIHGHLHVRQLDSCFVCRDSHLDRIIDHSLHSDENLAYVRRVRASRPSMINARWHRPEGGLPYLHDEWAFCVPTFFHRCQAGSISSRRWRQSRPAAAISLPRDRNPVF